LKGFFSTAQRPNQTQFHDFIDSTVSLAESNAGNITLTGGVVLGGTGVPAVPGAIRWNGTNFEFHTGAGFQALTFGAGVTNPLVVGNARLGSDILANGTLSAFGHNTQYNSANVGFSQDAGGTTTVNSPPLGNIKLKNSGANAAMTVQGNNVTVHNLLTAQTQLVIGVAGAGNPPIPANTKLAVYGEALKLSGNAWVTMSDVRTKKDIADFSEGLDKLVQVNCVRFKYKNMEGVEGCDKEQVGILAHEMRKIFPYMIGESKGRLSADDIAETDLLTFDSSALSFVIINAIKELNQRLQNLEHTATKVNN